MQDIELARSSQRGIHAYSRSDIDCAIARTAGYEGSSRTGSRAAFLRKSLAEGAQDVLKLEAMARRETLLGERQRITHAKAFKRAKYSLQIRSVRAGFAPPDVPRHRWRQFVSDCQSFLNSSENWAERAAELGWDARALFGCHRNYPLMHLGSAGLLWAVNGGKLVELHRDWAVIELPVNRSQRIFSRRDVAAGKVILPWDRA